MKMHIIRNRIKYPLKNLSLVTNVTKFVLKILQFEGNSVLELAQEVPGSKRVKFSEKNKKMFGFESFGSLKWF